MDRASVFGRHAGLLALIGACTIWGLSPLLYAELTHIPPIEVMAHRTLWSCVFFGALLMWQRRLGAVGAALTTKGNAGRLLIATVMIGLNWFFFIWAIGQGRTTEASLGYYIFPLVAVLLGQIFFSERLSLWQWISAALAAAAVLVLSIGLRAPPYIALILAVSFGIYGLIKKRLEVGPVVSVTAEVILLTPIAVVILWLGNTGVPGLKDGTLLLLSGPLTALPLILFSAATRRLRMATVGLVQYLNPTLQFLTATLILGEVLTRWHAIAFPLIWAALAIYSAAAWRSDAAARSSPASSASSTTR